MKNYLKFIPLLIAGSGILLSSYLWWFQVNGAQYIPCTISGCSHVLTSEYGKMFGVPVAVYGFFYYVIISLLIFEKLFVNHKLIDNLLYFGVGWGVIYSLYLRYLEFFKIGEICAWCWLSVLIVVILSVIYGRELYLKLKEDKKYFVFWK